MCADIKEVKLTELERQVLIGMKNQGCNYITRNKKGALYFWGYEPIKNKQQGAWFENHGIRFGNIFSDLFTFIKWDTKKPYNVYDLLDIAKIKITDEEYKILKEIKKDKVNGYEWIARNKDNSLCLYKGKPTRMWSYDSSIDINFWVYDGNFKKLDYCEKLFSYIQWKNEEPYSIKELLGEN